MNYSVQQIAKITNSEIIGNPSLTVKNISFDTRKIYVVKQTAFIALNTSKDSGEKYIENAIEKGISIIISEKRTNNSPNITWILVKNTTEFLRQLTKYHTKHNPLQTIAITGSNGKTIVKEWLFQCLNEDYNIVKSPKSFNSQIGLPLSLLEIKKENNLGIFEVGISQPGEMKKQAALFAPDLGILTYIGSAHSANFESEIALINEKILLFESCNTIFYHGDNPLVNKQLHQTYSSKKLITYGFEDHNQIHTIGDWTDKSKEVSVKIGDEKISFPSSSRDRATISNALCVIAVLNHLGFPPPKIIEKINQLKAVEMRLESVVGERNNLIINDYYNLDVDSLVIAYQFIKEYKKEHKTLLLTDFLEGKESSQNFYKKIAELTNQQGFNTIYLIGNEITNYRQYFEAETFTFSSINELIDSQSLNKIENSLILLKGARKFEIEKLKTFLELQKHDTVLEVNLNAILHNINVHRSVLPANTKVMAMVKAFSYGLGGYEIAEFLQLHHIDYLGVAYADEGVDLRKNGITTPIIVMNPEQSSYRSIIEYNLEPEIYSFRVLDLFYDKLLEQGVSSKYPIHIKLETGMHRLGFKEDELPHLIERLNRMNLKVASVFSHLSSADLIEERDYTLQQIEIFKKMTSQLINGLGYRPLLHILNSAGSVNYPQYAFDMVRLGIGMVGVSSNPSIGKQLQSAVTFKTVISQISWVNKGETVGYSRKFKPEDETQIATIPVGYADGIPRMIGNQVGSVGINNQLYPIVGNVCMDMMMINVTGSDVKEGDEVILFNGHPTLEQFANYCNTIPYEVLTSISRRVKRKYIKT